MSTSQAHALTVFLLLVTTPLLLTESASARAQNIAVDSIPWNSANEPSSLAGKPSNGKAQGSRAGKAFTTAGKKEIDAANAEKNGGVNKCENCGTEVVPGQKSESGVSPPINQRERDHIIPKSKGGEGQPANGQVLCRECNLEKSNKAP